MAQGKRRIKKNKGKGIEKQDQRGRSRGPKRPNKKLNGRDRCDIDVASMWNDAASMRHRCGIDVASMWIDGGPNMKKRRKTKIK